MEHKLTTDPREVEASLLIQFETDADLAVGGHELRHGVKGEIQVDLAAPLRDEPVPVRLRRLGLYSFNTPLVEPVGELSLSVGGGRGSLEPAEHGVWRLHLEELTAELTYDQLDSRHEPPPEPDFDIAASETFAGPLTLDVTPVGRDLRLDDGSLDLERVGAERGGLRRLQLDLRGQRALPLRRAAPTRLYVPLKPVSFPLRDGSWTGAAWADQLARANAIWGKCCIEFEGRSFRRVADPDLAYTTSVRPVVTSYRIPGAVEVYFVVSDRGGHTAAAGSARAAVILSEANLTNPNLLAHELGHVLAGCHPVGGCDPRLWQADRNTVLRPANPNPSRNTARNCQMGRRVQPLLQTRGEPCTPQPDGGGAVPDDGEDELSVPGGKEDGAGLEGRRGAC